MEKKRQARRWRKEEEQRREQLRSSQGKNASVINTSKGKNADMKLASQKQDAGGEGDVQIPTKLKEVIEESDDEYPLHFDEPDSLLEIFATLEEKNLFLI